MNKGCMQAHIMNSIKSTALRQGTSHLILEQTGKYLIEYFTKQERKHGNMLVAEVDLMRGPGAI